MSGHKLVKMVVRPERDGLVVITYRRGARGSLRRAGVLKVPDRDVRAAMGKLGASEQ